MRTRGKLQVLVVDDEAEMRHALVSTLTNVGYAAEAAPSGAEALARVGAHRPDVIVSDLVMPDMDGIELLGAIQREHAGVGVIMLTSSADVRTAVRAMQAGAAQYLLKPVAFGELTTAIERAAQTAVAARVVDHARALPENTTAAFEGVLGLAPVMLRLYKVASQVSASRATVLITGESGTGKGELARAIHARSPRAGGPFVAVHCAALAETLLESELFGHEKGSFTGADKRRLGRFEQAHGGTLFLDEVGEIPPSTQLRLLRVLQERTFERVGGNESIRVDVRVIAATNRDLRREVELGRFREDLFYRLNVVRIEVPPLRVRGDDIEMLADHFLARFAKENGKDISGFTEAAVAKMRAHRWPGNVRELENTIERAVVLAEGSAIDAEDLPIYSTTTLGGEIHVPGATLAELERHAILTTLEAVGGSTSRAAEILGVSARMIQYRLHEYGLAQPRGRRPSGRLPDPRLS